MRNPGDVVQHTLAAIVVLVFVLIDRFLHELLHPLVLLDLLIYYRLCLSDLGVLLFTLELVVPALGASVVQRSVHGTFSDLSHFGIFKSEFWQFAVA